MAADRVPAVIHKWVIRTVRRVNAPSSRCLFDRIESRPGFWCGRARFMGRCSSMGRKPGLNASDCCARTTWCHSLAEQLRIAEVLAGLSGAPAAERLLERR